MFIERYGSFVKGQDVTKEVIEVFSIKAINSLYAQDVPVCLLDT